MEAKTFCFWLPATALAEAAQLQKHGASTAAGWSGRPAREAKFAKQLKRSHLPRPVAAVGLEAHPPQELPPLLEAWVAQCKEVMR
mmetsp:Transcript_8834/g.20916  ORF Transcript_8834/g.20916 Transcript_8834/m.20916 type:complete len:85 (+) Transcript_8834:398-652(+)